MRYGIFVRLWTVHNEIKVHGSPDRTGHYPADGWTVTCPVCDADQGLRIIIVAPLSILWCTCRHAWSEGWMQHQSLVEALLANREDSQMHEYHTDSVDAPWPPDLLERYPGVDVVLDNLGSLVKTTLRRHDGPTRADAPWLLRLPSATDPAAEGDLRRTAAAASAFYDDYCPTGKADDIVMVPLSQRELAALYSITYTRTPALPTERVLHDFVLDLKRRAHAMESTGPAEARRVLAAHSTGAEALMGIGRWADHTLRQPFDDPSDRDVDGEKPQVPAAAGT